MGVRSAVGCHRLCVRRAESRRDRRLEIAGDPCRRDRAPPPSSRRRRLPERALSPRKQSGFRPSPEWRP